jgi:hypothetical protein
MSNPTSNYNFQMPTATDLVTDLPADFEVFGQAVDTQMKTNADAATQKATLTTKGDLYVASAASTPARLAVGTNNFILTADSSTATGVKWAAAPGGGKILQVVTATTSTSTSNATNTYADTTLTANITPSSASSRVMVIVMHPYTTIKSAQEVSIDIQLLRDATVIHNPPSGVNSFFIGGAAGANAWSSIEHFGILNFSILDSPATTSAITYKTQFKAPNAGTIQVQRNSYTSTIILLEVGA